MAKNRRKKKKISKSTGLFSKKKIALVLLACFSAFLVVYAVSYFQGVKTHRNDDNGTTVLMAKMKKMLEKEKARLEVVKKKVQEEKKEEKKVVIVKPKTNNDYKKIEPKKPLTEKKPLEVVKDTYLGKKPKLAIVIDDVAFAHQTKLIKKIPFKVSPSFFPPTKKHPNTVKLSHTFEFAMIHLPTEAQSFGRPEPQTLLVGDTKEKIRERIQNIKKWFPTIKYYNNHTGSKFTADLTSMDYLLSVMMEEKLHFVDSRTTAQTKAPELAKKYGLKLYARDVFIDNDSDKSLIRKQLLKAVAIAKKRGYAMAIGHPHANTLDVLIHAKDLLKDVELVYLKDL